jgi:hypothetical protein
MVQSQIYRKENSTMKKDYLKPEGKVVALRMNENISLSGFPTNDRFGIHYTIEGDKKYIFGDTRFEASNTKNDRYDRFYDLLLAFINNIDPNCLFDPDDVEE